MTPPITIGTVGWTHNQWQPDFYADGLETCEWLGHYASHFSHVEVEQSFHQLPERHELVDWLERTPEHFRFTLTVPRAITHEKQLKNADNQWTQLLTRLEGLEGRIPRLRFSMPAGWRCNLRRLDDLLSWLPGTFRYVFQADDQSWLEDDALDLLRGHQAAICIHDTGAGQVPLVSTTDLVYVRLDGNTSRATGSYHPQTLRGWLGKARSWQRKTKHVVLSFGGADALAALKNARRLASQLASAEVQQKLT